VMDDAWVKGNIKSPRYCPAASNARASISLLGALTTSCSDVMLIASMLACAQVERTFSDRVGVLSLRPRFAWASEFIALPRTTPHFPQPTMRATQHHCSSSDKTSILKNVIWNIRNLLYYNDVWNQIGIFNKNENVK
jgi:hypothetical protein